MQEKNLISRIEQDLAALKMGVKDTPGRLDSKWDSLLSTEPRKFINEDLTINLEGLRNFRRDIVFISDTPVHVKPGLGTIKALLSGGHRGERRLLKDAFAGIDKEGLLPLLKKFPCNGVGNPNICRHKGYQFTLRWLRHIYLTGTLGRHTGDRLNAEFFHLDVGSSYGLFEHLLKMQYSGGHSILVDFPEQLVLAHYYLGMSFPEAKIAGFQEVLKAQALGRDFLRKYDFILVPWFMYEKISPQTIDLFTNFASFGEMKREWFDYYLKKEPFLSARIFYCVNRFQSAPTYDTDLTILDYPLAQFEKKQFRISPFFSHTYQRKAVFFCAKVPFSSQYFEFVGVQNSGATNMRNR